MFFFLLPVWWERFLSNKQTSTWIRLDEMRCDWIVQVSPENMPSQKETRKYSNHPFSGAFAVSLPEGTLNSIGSYDPSPRLNDPAETEKLDETGADGWGGSVHGNLRYPPKATPP